MYSLVNYSSSESDADEDHRDQPEKKMKLDAPKTRLPLPSQIKDMQIKSVNDKPVEEPDKHDGRVRSFEHERGNWATYVYIPVEIAMVEDLQESLKETLPELDLKQTLDVHISLTRTLVLQHHWIESFVESIRSELAGIEKFRIIFRGLKIYCNDERTRTFMGLSVNDGNTCLLEKISKRLDSILKEFRLPEFYTDASFHASILWCVGDHETFLNDQINALEGIVESYFNKYPRDFDIKVNNILFSVFASISLSSAFCRRLPSGVFAHHAVKVSSSSR